MSRLLLSASSIATLAWALASSSAFAAAPTAQEQYWLELLNQARADPAGELERLVNYATPTTFANPSSDIPGVSSNLTFWGTSASALASQWAGLGAAAPLAWNDSLQSSAAAYNQVMVTMDQQSHMLTGTGTAGDRIEQRILGAGYSANFLELGENLFANAQSAQQGHAAYLIDWGDGNGTAPGYGTGIQVDTSTGEVAGHRVLSFDPLVKEFGGAIQTAGIPVANVNVEGPVVNTQHFGSRFVTRGVNYFSESILTGVIYNDGLLVDNFYTPGEGLGGVTVNVYNDLTNALLFSESTTTSGGFNIDLLGLSIGDRIRIEAPATGLPGQVVTLGGFVTDTSVYGAEVTFVNNARAAFQIVPEPASLLAVLSLGLSMGTRRRRSFATLS